MFAAHFRTKGISNNDKIIFQWERVIAWWYAKNLLLKDVAYGVIIKRSEHMESQRRNEIFIGNNDKNYLGILPQKQLPKHFSLPRNSRVKIDFNVYNNTTTNGINSWKVIQVSSAHVTNIFETEKYIQCSIYPNGTR